jgi:hypothetical protein
MIMAEPRLYLYRKAGREVWDAEMWLPDGRRRVWRTGMADRNAALAAAGARLEALAGVQSAAPIEAGGLGGARAPVASMGGSARMTTPLLEQAKAPANAPMCEPASAGERIPAEAASADAGRTLASEGRAQALQTPETARKMGTLERFDRWFFADLRRVLGGNVN